MLEVQRRQTLDVTDRLNLHVDKASEIVALSTGTSSSEQAQAQLATSLKWDISHLHTRLSELLSAPNKTDPKKSHKIFDKFLCESVGQEEDVAESDSNWMVTDEVMDTGGSLSLDEDDVVYGLAGAPGSVKDKSSLRWRELSSAETNQTPFFVLFNSFTQSQLHLFKRFILRLVDWLID